MSGNGLTPRSFEERVCRAGVARPWPQPTISVDATPGAPMTTTAAKKPSKKGDVRTTESPYPVVPWLKTKLPGPRAKAAIALDNKYVSPSYTRSYPFVMAKGFGLAAEDVDGNVFLDF